MAGNIKGITIEIGGNTTKLEKALKDVNAGAKDLNKQLKEVEASLKFNPGNSELVAQKQRILAESIDNTKKKLETLKEAQEQAKKSLEEGKIGQEQYDALRREVIKTENQLKSFQGELKNTKLSLEKVGNSVKDFGGKVSKVGDGLTKGVTAPIIGFGVAAIAAFNEVNSGLDTVIKKTGATGDAAKELENIYRDVATSIPTDFDTASNAVGEINTQFGLTGDKLKEVSIELIKFSKINDSDVTQSTIQAKAVMEQFKVATGDVGKVLDAVTKTAQNTGQSVDKIFDSVSKNAPQLQSMGLDFAQAAEMMGRMEQKGIDSSKAIGYLTKAQTEWAKDGKSLTKGLEELEKKLGKAKNGQEKLAIAAETFGTKGGAFMLNALEKGALKAGDLKGAMEQAAGAVSNTFEATKDPIDSFDQAMNGLKLIGNDVAVTLQESLAPIIEQITGKIKEWVDAWRNLSPEMQQTILKVVGIVAVVGPILSIVGRFISGIGQVIIILGKLKGLAIGSKIAGFVGKAIGGIKALGASFVALTGPVGIVIAIIAAIIGVVVLLYNKCEWFRDAVHAIWDAIKNFFIQLWEGIKTTVVAVWEGLTETLSAIWNGIIEGAKAIWNGLADFFVGLWEGIKTTVETVLNVIKTIIETVWNVIKTVIETVLNVIKTVIETVWNTIKTVVETVLNAIKTFIETIWNGIKTVVETVINTIKTVIETVWNTIKTITSTVWNGIKSFLTGLWNGIKSVVETVFGAIKGFFQGVWEAIKGATESVWNGIKDFLSGLWNGIKETAGNVWQGIVDAIMKPINWLQDKIKGAMNAVKKFLGMESDVDRVNDKATSARSGGPSSRYPRNFGAGGGIPRRNTHRSIDWYDKGGIFTSPTIIGVGEKRPEFVGALEDLKGLMREVLREEGGGAAKQVVHSGTVYHHGINDKGALVGIVKEIIMDDFRRDVRFEL